MKFDFCIGNPPYQNESIGDNESFSPPTYNLFMDAVYQVASKVELITPARFLFNAGRTPKAWNKKMLSDEHLKVLYYAPKSKAVFLNTDIKGGVAITYRDSDLFFGSIDTFTSYPELNAIKGKASPNADNSLMNIIFVQNRYNLPAMYKHHPDLKQCIGSEGKDRRFRSNAFDKIRLFTESRVKDSDIKVLGVINNKRVWRYFPKEFFDDNHPNFHKYKVLLPAANGSGALGEIHSTPLIGYPLIGYTQTFIGIGAFDQMYEAENALKYIKTKFCRTMLGILKVTQTNNRDTWKYVPIQDFTYTSDIDWSKSVAGIDQQLYKKYGLSQEEIDFIETHVKEME